MLKIGFELKKNETAPLKSERFSFRGLIMLVEICSNEPLAVANFCEDGFLRPFLQIRSGAEYTLIAALAGER